MQDLITWGLLALSLATALVAGVFLTFSDFVMRSLAGSSPAAGSEAMQVINRKVYRSVFMVLLLGLVPVTALMAGLGWFALQGPAGGALLAGGGFYLLGVFGVTVIGNVPMNQRLDAMPLGGAEARAYWPDYLRGWLRWNHLRTLSATCAAAAFAAAPHLM